eukprot:TRINITY_DN83340_c0_g1_i1.p1 TRINITY_DN83340_c0_g1~~TRINITY_DN83340_c0_g1_i1.p1  ORF type:complete len:277 (+),score=89.42 TRINITY_DN83340_c0_g1_i1:61-891(+)
MAICRSWLLLLWAALLGVAAQDDDIVDENDVEDDVLTTEQMRKLHQRMDLNGDGRVSLAESLQYAVQTGRAIASKDVGAILDELDTSKDGRLSLDEHVQDIKNQAEGGDEQEMKELQSRLAVEKEKFTAADGNSDGFLDQEELASLFYPETHDGVLEVTVRETMRQKDRNGDGKLSAHEFWEADPNDGDDGQLTDEEKVDFEKLDANHDGSLSIEELRAWESGRFHTEEAMKSLFDIGDKDSDMHMTADELVAAREQIALSDAHYHLIEWAEHHEL